MISETIEDLVTLADGLEAHFNKYPGAFSEFGSLKDNWFIYINPHTKDQVIVHIDEKRYIYVSVNSRSVMFSEYRLSGWHPWHSNTKKYNNSWNKIRKISDAVSGDGEPSKLERMFPELAQDKLEEAVWGKKDE
jgi:hypothetical protein